MRARRLRLAAVLAVVAAGGSAGSAFSGGCTKTEPEPRDALMLVFGDAGVDGLLDAPSDGPIDAYERVDAPEPPF